jgi:hypothetical protein
MWGSSRVDRIHKQILDRRRYLLNRIEGNVGAYETGFVLGNSARRIVHHQVQPISGQ